MSPRGTASRADRPSGQRRRTRHRAVSMLLALLVLGSLASLGSAVRARPAGADTDRAAPTTQVRITLSTLTPMVVKAASTVTVSGTLRNLTATTFSAAIIRLQAGPPLTSRAQLRQAVARPPAADAALCDFADLSGQIAAHSARHFQVSCSAKHLGLRQAGVYPMLVNLNATPVGGSPARVGELHTFLPFFPKPPSASTQVGWLWPIIDRPHQTKDGVFLDDDLARSFASGGRLANLVAIAARAPAAVHLTLAIDPDLVAAATTMTRPYQLMVNGEPRRTTRGQRAASSWLTALRALAAKPAVTAIALPYADPDIVALEGVGLGALVSSGYTTGAAVLAADLRIQRTLPIAWPADGAINHQTEAALIKRNVGSIVIDAADVRGGDGPGAAVPLAPAAAGGNGQTTALLADDALGAAVDPRTATGGPRLAEQLFASELAMLTVTHPATSQTVLVAPPRRFDPQPGLGGALLADTATLPWSTSVGVDALSSAAGAASVTPIYPTAARDAELPANVTHPLAGTVRSLRAFAGSLHSVPGANPGTGPDTGPGTQTTVSATQLVAPFLTAALRVGSSAWRADPLAATPYLDNLTKQVTAFTSNAVALVKPLNGTYSLASSSSPLVVTLDNTLAVDVTVKIVVTAQGTAGFESKPVIKHVLANSKPTIRVPAHVDRSGYFRITVRLETADGSPLGPPVDLRVRSTAYGALAIGITVGALVLLALLVTRRLYQRFRRSRNTVAVPDGVAVAGSDPDASAPPADSAATSGSDVETAPSFVTDSGPAVAGSTEDAESTTDPAGRRAAHLRNGS